MMFNIGHDAKRRKKKRKKKMERETATEDEKEIEVQLASVTLPSSALKVNTFGVRLQTTLPRALEA